MNDRNRQIITVALVIAKRHLEEFEGFFEPDPYVSFPKCPSHPPSERELDQLIDEIGLEPYT